MCLCYCSSSWVWACFFLYRYIVGLMCEVDPGNCLDPRLTWWRIIHITGDVKCWYPSTSRSFDRLSRQLTSASSSAKFSAGWRHMAVGSRCQGRDSLWLQNLIAIHDVCCFSWRSYLYYDCVCHIFCWWHDLYRSITDVTQFCHAIKFLILFGYIRYCDHIFMTVRDICVAILCNASNGFFSAFVVLYCYYMITIMNICVNEPHSHAIQVDRTVTFNSLLFAQWHNCLLIICFWLLMCFMIYNILFRSRSWDTDIRLYYHGITNRSGRGSPKQQNPKTCSLFPISSEITCPVPKNHTTVFTITGITFIPKFDIQAAFPRHPPFPSNIIVPAIAFL